MKELLSNSEVLIKERDFFLNPFDYQELKKIFKNVDPKKFLAIKSPSYTKMSLDLNLLTRGDILTLMHNEPRLIKRPLIITSSNHIFIGNSKLDLDDIIQ